MKSEMAVLPPLNTYYGVDWWSAKALLKPAVLVSTTVASNLAFFGYDSRGAVFFCYGTGKGNAVLITPRALTVRLENRIHADRLTELMASVPDLDVLEHPNSTSMEGIEVNTCSDSDGRDLICLDIEGQEYLIVICPEKFIPGLGTKPVAVAAPTKSVPSEPGVSGDSGAPAGQAPTALH